MILGEGRGFEVAQGRLGPGRIHHCMRAIGLAEAALKLMCQRSLNRTAFGRPLAKLGGNVDIIADARMQIEMTRLLCLKAAWLMDNVGTDAAQVHISMIKTIAPTTTLKPIDEANTNAWWVGSVPRYTVSSLVSRNAYTTFCRWRCSASHGSGRVTS